MGNLCRTSLSVDLQQAFGFLLQVSAEWRESFSRDVWAAPCPAPRASSKQQEGKLCPTVTLSGHLTRSKALFSFALKPRALLRRSWHWEWNRSHQWRLLWASGTSPSRTAPWSAFLSHLATCSRSLRHWCWRKLFCILSPQLLPTWSYLCQVDQREECLSKALEYLGRNEGIS